MAPSAAPIRMARLAARLGTFMIQSVKSAIPGMIFSPTGTRPSMTITAVMASRPASTRRTLNARNAAEAMNQANRANMVICNGT